MRRCRAGRQPIASGRVLPRSAVNPVRTDTTVVGPSRRERSDADRRYHREPPARRASAPSVASRRCLRLRLSSPESVSEHVPLCDGSEARAALGGSCWYERTCRSRQVRSPGPDAHRGRSGCFRSPRLHLAQRRRRQSGAVRPGADDAREACRGAIRLRAATGAWDALIEPSVKCAPGPLARSPIRRHRELEGWGAEFLPVRASRCSPRRPGRGGAGRNPARDSDLRALACRRGGQERQPVGAKFRNFGKSGSPSWARTSTSRLNTPAHRAATTGCARA